MKAREERGSRAFEDLVGWIHGALEPNARVRTRRRLLDSTNGRLREVDVSIESQVGPTALLTVVEARRRKKRIGPDYVDEVASRRDALGADLAAIASASGFTRGALRKANATRIRCFEVRRGPMPMEMRDWLALECLIVPRGDISLVETVLETSRTILAEPPSWAQTFESSTDGTQAFAWSVLEPSKLALVGLLSPERPRVLVRVHFEVPNTAELWCRHATDGWLQVFRGTFVVDVRTSLEPLQFTEQARYLDAQDERSWAEIHIARTEIMGEEYEVDVLCTARDRGDKLHVRVVDSPDTRGFVTVHPSAPPRRTDQDSG